MQYEIHNAKRYLTFLVGIVVLCIMSILPRAVRNYDDWTLYLPIVVFVFSFTLTAIIRPAYFSLTFQKDRLLFRTHPLQEETDNVFLQEYAGYELKESLWGLRHKLVIYRKHPKGLLKSAPYMISFLTGKQKKELEFILEKLKGYK